MSDATVVIRSLPGGAAALDAFEAFEKAIGLAVSEPTTDNVTAAAAAGSSALTAATTALSQAAANPTQTGQILVADAVKILGDAFSKALSSKFGQAVSVDVTDVSSLLSEVQTIVAKL